MLLAIDTSTAFAGVALVRDATTLAELNWQVGQRHGSDLLPRVAWMLRGAGVAPVDLTGVAVALGPGSFNGIRVAVATAKSLAIGLRVPLVGVPTLDAIAWGYALVDAEIWAVVEAGRGQLYAARYQGPAVSTATWAPRDGYLLLSPAELGGRVERMALIVGEFRPETAAALAADLGPRVRFASVAAPRRAVWLAELAMARAAAGQYDDAARIEPLYLQRPAITTGARSAPAHSPQRAEDSTGSEGEEHALHR